MSDSEADSAPDALASPDELAGWAVLHLFLELEKDPDTDAIERAIKQCQADGHQVISVELLGHKGDLGVVGIGPSFERLRQLQSELRNAGCATRSSYVSLTELSEYSGGVPDEMKLARLRPTLPPEGMPAFCFYPMSKRRTMSDNWYALSYEDRLALMMGHGKVGRRFHGRVVQLVTGSTGLDDWEWGVTLFGRTFDDLKACVYEMRFDTASAHYAEFGPFVSGTIGSPGAILSSLGRR